MVLLHKVQCCLFFTVVSNKKFLVVGQDPHYTGLYLHMCRSCVHTRFYRTEGSYISLSLTKFRSGIANTYVYALLCM